VVGGVDGSSDVSHGLAIDDFGTAYSALWRRQGLPFHTLKIDSSFVKSVKNPNDEAPIVAAMIVMVTPSITRCRCRLAPGKCGNTANKPAESLVNSSLDRGRLVAERWPAHSLLGTADAAKQLQKQIWESPAFRGRRAGSVANPNFVPDPAGGPRHPFSGLSASPTSGNYGG
jgi:hypothetical protein